MVRACPTSPQPLQNHSSGHIGGWATPWSAEEILDGPHQRVDIPAHARTAGNGLVQETQEENLCGIDRYVPRTLKVSQLIGILSQVNHEGPLKGLN